MSRPPISRRRKITFALITTALFLAVANGAVVLYEKLQYGGTQAEKEGIYIQREDGRRVLRPGAVLEGARTKVRINSLGFRGPELLSPKPENGFRVYPGEFDLSTVASRISNVWVTPNRRISRAGDSLFSFLRTR